jgi:hypothetical protein
MQVQRNAEHQRKHAEVSHQVARERCNRAARQPVWNVDGDRAWNEHGEDCRFDQRPDSRPHGYMAHRYQPTTHRIAPSAARTIHIILF